MVGTGPGRTGPPADHDTGEEPTMYDMYPERGPSHLRDDDEGTSAVQVALDRRDNGGDRPDDN